MNVSVYAYPPPGAATEEERRRVPLLYAQQCHLLLAPLLCLALCCIIQSQPRRVQLPQREKSIFNFIRAGCVQTS